MHERLVDAYEIDVVALETRSQIELNRESEYALKESRWPNTSSFLWLALAWVTVEAEVKVGK